MDNHISPEQVTDRTSFIKFLSSLRNEFENDEASWENNTLDSFLEALERYADDIQGYYHNVHPDINADVPTWRTFADILKGASIYE